MKNRDKQKLETSLYCLAVKTAQSFYAGDTLTYLQENLPELLRMTLKSTEVLGTKEVARIKRIAREGVVFDRLLFEPNK